MDTLPNIEIFGFSLQHRPSDEPRDYVHYQVNRDGFSVAAFDGGNGWTLHICRDSKTSCVSDRASWDDLEHAWLDRAAVETPRLYAAIVALTNAREAA